MATKESGEISGNKYNLGDYKFELVQEPVSGSSNTKYTAVCRHAGKAARKSIIIPGIYVSWYVNANDTTADVYVIVKEPGAEKVPQKSFSGCSAVTVYDCNEDTQMFFWSYESHWGGYVSYFPDAILYSGNPQTVQLYSSMSLEIGGHTGTYAATSRNSNGAYWCNVDFNDGQGKTSPIYGPAFTSIEAAGAAVSAQMQYIEKEYLVGRFPIELKDAGGVGPGSDWDDPGDYDEDRDPEDPTNTLYLTVEGALSGRHNDPLNDTSYSYIPSDKDTVKNYGCGGDGGNGGGGGAGAANVVVFKFGTNEADHKDITTIAKRHGYGSGGGKGGKGGAGCILIYY